VRDRRRTRTPPCGCSVHAFTRSRAVSVSRARRAEAGASTHIGDHKRFFFQELTQPKNDSLGFSVAACHPPVLARRVARASALFAAMQPSAESQKHQLRVERTHFQKLMRFGSGAQKQVAFWGGYDPVSRIRRISCSQFAVASASRNFLNAK